MSKKPGHETYHGEFDVKTLNQKKERKNTQSRHNGGNILEGTNIIKGEICNT
jgi:hypothetical protein